MPYKLVKRVSECWSDFSYRSWLIRRKPSCRRYQKVFMNLVIHIRVHVRIVKVSRVCKPCKILDVRKYVSYVFSMVKGTWSRFTPSVNVRRPVPVPFSVF